MSGSLGKTFFAICALATVSTSCASADAEFGCTEGRWLKFYTSNGDHRAAWGTTLNIAEKKVRASCGYSAGYEFKLRKLNLWTDGEPADRGVWVYRGLGNTCSEGTLLIFNERTASVLVVKTSDFVSTSYKCERATSD